jgi:hypothetical protein
MFVVVVVVGDANKQTNKKGRKEERGEAVCPQD